MVPPTLEETTSDIDAEGEEDTELDLVGELDADGEMDDPDGEGEEEEDDDDAGAEQEEPQGEDEDAEGEEEDAEGDDDEDNGAKPEYYGAVKLPDNESLVSEEEASDDEQESAAEVESGSGSDSSSSESEAENEWEAESVGVEGEVDIAARNNCIFCNQDEEHDPGEEFEEILSCAVCGDNSHRQCARENNSFTDDIDPAAWRCPDCTANALEADGQIKTKEKEDDALLRRLSVSSNRLPRELLPAARGTTKPGSHSIFNTLILDDGPADGSRALRKRKASSEALELPSRGSSKRAKKSDEDREQTLSPVIASRRARSGTAISRSRRTPAFATEHNDQAQAETIVAQAATRTVRYRRQKKESGLARVILTSAESCILAFKIDLSKIKTQKRKRNRDRHSARSARPAVVASRPQIPAQSITPYSTPFYAFHDREEDEVKKKPYGGILSEADADTSKTMPLSEDRAKFEKARQAAEQEWKQKTAAAEAEQEVKSRASQKIAGPPSKIKCINFGGYEIETWYAAPYPEEYSRNRVLYICEFCLKYMSSDYVAWRHKLKCPAKHPPGDEIYRNESVSVFEVDGRKNPAYCQNLCLLAKLFLGSKTLYYDVEPFLFYIMTEYDELGCHFVGYFSKEKRPSSLNNVSCILTLPIHQRKGYGNLLIDFSYLLTRVEKKTGSPEKPLSDMGLVSYRNYWRLILCYLLIEQEKPLSITDISDRTGMTADDIVAALEALRALVRDPVTKTYALRLDKAYFKETIEKWEAKGYVRLNPDALMWTPYVMGRSNLANYDRPALATIAPREGDDNEDAMPEEGVQQLNLDDKQQPQQSDMKSDAQTNGDTVPDIGTDEPGLPLPSTADPNPPITSSSTSPAKPPSILALTNGTSTSSPALFGAASSQPHVPPTRYELYPPVPGTTYRSRRGGYRPKGSRITIHGPIFASGSTALSSPATASRRTNGLRAATSGKRTSERGKGKMGAVGSPGLRMTRSQVGTPVADGRMDEFDALDDEKEEKREDEEEGDNEEENTIDTEDKDADGEDDDEEAGAQAEEVQIEEPDAEGDEEYVEGGDEDAEGEEEDVGMEHF